MSTLLEQRLLNLWKKYEGALGAKKLNDILARGFCYSRIERNYPILVVGINPSFRQGDPACGEYVRPFDYQDAITNYHDRYYAEIDALFPERWKQEVAYLDLLNYRETEQKVLYDFYKTGQGISFVAENIALNQLFIEQVVRPRLILVKNKGAWDFWGKNASGNENIWMGYRLELAGTYPCGDLCRITGLIEHPDRVNYPVLMQTALLGTSVLFTNHFQYCSADKRPTPELITSLCEAL